MKISEDKKNKISEQILHLLYERSPQALFTSQIAKEIARDEEFAKSILLDLNKKGFIIKISKNPKGVDYSRRQRWRLSSDIQDYYKKSSTTINNLNPLDNLN